MRISDGSSDVCSSDLRGAGPDRPRPRHRHRPLARHRRAQVATRRRLVRMTFATSSALSGVLGSIPSPEISFIQLGPVRIYFYALCIIVGIIAATLLTNARLTRRGAEPWVVIDIALLAEIGRAHV